MKKKILALVLTVALLAVATIGTTMAYFQDTESATNVFTMGNVDIELKEAGNNLEDDEYRAWLASQLLEPSVELPKNVWVNNIGKNPAYVRVIVLVPADLDPMLDYTWKNTEWTATTGYAKFTVGDLVGYSFTYTGNGNDDGKLVSGDATDLVLESVALKPYVTCSLDANNNIVYNYGNKTFTDADGIVDIIVYAEAGQTNGAGAAFNNADDALNLMFGTPVTSAAAKNFENTATAPVVVTDADEFIEALEAGSDVAFDDDVKISPASMSNAYGTTGINVKNGQTIDGNGNILDIKGAGGTWDSGISTTGGLIKNIKVTGSFRGIFINHNSTHSERVVLENVTIEGTTYTISCDQGTYNGLTATNSTFNGWTSYAATLGDAEFYNCNFGYGNGYKFCRPYAPTKFVNCEFCEGYTIDPRAAVTFENCTVNGVALTADNLSTLVTASNIANAAVIG